MPVDLKFYTYKEKQPDEGKEVAYFRPSGDGHSFEYGLCEVEYSWVEFDEDGYETGVSHQYTGPANHFPTPKPPSPTCKLKALVEGEYMEDDWVWAYLKDVDFGLFRYTHPELS